MGNVDWESVPKPEQEAAPPKSSVAGTIGFIVFLIVGVTAGGGYVNSVMLGERVRDLVVAECPDPTCAVDVRAAHAQCFSDNVTYGAPSSLDDFQTPPTSPKLGIGTVNLDAYRPCVQPAKPKTLAEQ